MRLVMLGGSGSGRGTQSQLLGKALNISWISSGEMLRQAIATQSDLGKTVAAGVNQGELVPDEVMIELVSQRLSQPDAAHGWVLDGYPCTAFQAEELDFLLDRLDQNLNWAIWLDVSREILVQRSMERSRSDDTPDAIQRRIDLLYERTVPILDYYDYRHRLVKVNGNQPIEAVQQEIRAAIAAT
ncbi:MAG: adenylate kinase [Elainellaceae cyanobacterium]